MDTDRIVNSFRDMNFHVTLSQVVFDGTASSLVGCHSVSGGVSFSRSLGSCDLESSLLDRGNVN